MAWIDCHFYSEALGVCSSMYVLLPQPTSPAGRGGGTRRRLPVLYLLHGLSDDHTIWLRRTSLERYAAAYRLAVVMPAVNRSFYSDMVHGYRYWTHVSEEVPAVARDFFPISAKREDTFAAGLSMGGYGAFKLALRHPERFAAAASLSGAVDLAWVARGDLREQDIKLAFGAKHAAIGAADDLFALAKKVGRAAGRKPALFQCCGTLDFLIEGNRRFRDHARKAGLSLTYEESPAAHEWGYWDRQIQKVLEWLPLRKDSKTRG